MARLSDEQRAAVYANHCLKSYGLTPEALEAMKASQNHCCAACGDASDRLQVDHCHETNRVRGLLCSRCNNAAGQVGDDPERLRRIADYLEGDDIDFHGHRIPRGLA